MSLNLNQVTLAGHLTRDPAMRTLPSGSQVAEFGLALNDRYTDKSGQQVEQPCFVEIVAWAKSAEIAHTYLRKGDRLLLEGVLTYQAWRTENGDNPYFALICKNPCKTGGLPSRGTTKPPLFLSPLF